MTEPAPVSPAPPETTTGDPSTQPAPPADAPSAIGTAGVPLTAPATPIAPPQQNDWKKPLAILTAVILTALCAVVALEIVRPSPPPLVPYFLPLRVMGAAELREGPDARPRPLVGAAVQFEPRDRQNQPASPTRQLMTDPMGAANVPYTPDSALHIQVTAPDFAPRELWLDNPRQFALNTPDFILTLERPTARPRTLPLFIIDPVADSETHGAPPEPAPLTGIAVSFQYDPADPEHPETPTTLTTSSDGMVMLKFLPGRGATVAIRLTGYTPFEEHYTDSYDFERRRPTSIVELKRAAPKP